MRFAKGISSVTRLLIVKTLITILALLVALQSNVAARGVRSFAMPQLMSGSTIAIIGKIDSVKPSGLKTKLTYPTWQGITFEWLKVEVRVVESLKGTKKGKKIRVLMLSAPGGGPAFNPPGMLNVKEGDHLLMFLLPTTKEDIYAAMSAPWDEDQALFILDRKDGVENLTSIEMIKLIPTLVDAQGRILPDGIDKLRDKYEKQLAEKPAKTEVIHLKWKTMTSDEGWQWDVPDDAKEGQADPTGPVTR